MSQLFPKDEVALIESASTRGEIHKGFNRANDIAKNKAETKSAVMMALAYPAYILISTSVLFYFILQKAIPDIVRLQAVERWPEWTQPLYSMYVVVVENNHFLLSGLFALLVLVVLSLKLTKSGLRSILDRLPPWNIQKRNQSSIFLIALGDLITNGNSFPKAINRLEYHAPPYLRSYLSVIKDRMQSNQTVADSLDCGLFSKETIGFLKDFSTLPVFNKKIVEIGERALKETITLVKTLAGAV